MIKRDGCIQCTLDNGCDVLLRLIISDKLRSGAYIVRAELSEVDSERFLLIYIIELSGLCSTAEASTISLLAAFPLLFAAIAMLLAAITGFPSAYIGVVDIDDCRKEPCRRRFLFSPERRRLIERFGAIL